MTCKTRKTKTVVSIDSTLMDAFKAHLASTGRTFDEVVTEMIKWEIDETDHALPY